VTDSNNDQTKVNQQINNAPKISNIPPEYDQDLSSTRIEGLNYGSDIPLMPDKSLSSTKTMSEDSIFVKKEEK